MYTPSQPTEAPEEDETKAQSDGSEVPSESLTQEEAEWKPTRLLSSLFTRLSGVGVRPVRVRARRPLQAAGSSDCSSDLRNKGIEHS